MENPAFSRYGKGGVFQPMEKAILYASFRFGRVPKNQSIFLQISANVPFFRESDFSEIDFCAILDVVFIYPRYSKKERDL